METYLILQNLSPQKWIFWRFPKWHSSQTIFMQINISSIFFLLTHRQTGIQTSFRYANYALFTTFLNDSQNSGLWLSKYFHWIYQIFLICLIKIASTTQGLIWRSVPSGGQWENALKLLLHVNTPSYRSQPYLQKFNLCVHEPSFGALLNEINCSVAADTRSVAF